MEKLPQSALRKVKAIELLAFNHNITDKQVAVECGVSPQTLVA